MPEAKSYVRTDEDGVMRVGQTDVMLEGVIFAFEDGDSPESIHHAYRALSLEEIYGAITYYLSHKQEVGAYLDRQAALWGKMRQDQDQNPSPLIHRLRAKLASRNREQTT